MKLYYKLLFTTLLLGSLCISGCKKILEEHPESGIVPAFFNSPSGVLGGIAGVYNDIRGAWGTEGFTLHTMAGTDEYLMGASATGTQFFNYNGLQSGSMNNFWWNTAYQDINTLNGVLQFGQTIDGLPA